MDPISVLQKLGGRKFAAAILSCASATALCWFGHISDGVYSAVMIATVGAYMAANVGQVAVSK